MQSALTVGNSVALGAVAVDARGLAIARAPVSSDGFAEGLARRDTREYRPIWWDGQLHRETWQNAAIVDRGRAEVSATDQTGIDQSFNIRAEDESIISLRPLYFPGWVARVDGSKVALAPGEDGHVQLNIEPGEHTLTLKFEDTWPRILGKAVSAICCIILLMVLYRGYRRRDTLQL